MRILSFILVALLSMPVAAVEIFPLDRVRAGMQAEGVTVFGGDQAERFGVEVLGVLPSFIGPGQDLILARLRGERIEYTGVIAGMSGSPVYVDGKLLGAVSYRLGAFSKEPIAGITPAALMFDAAATSPGPRWAELSREEGAPNLVPIETPVFVAGASAGLIDHYAKRLQKYGLVLQRGGAQTGAQAGALASARPFFSGGPMAGLLVSGDLMMAATGTVTVVSDSQILGFGHPFLGGGKSQIPLAQARVLTTLPSLLGSYKISNVGPVVGTLVEDRSTAVVGRLGQIADTIPVRIRMSDQRQGRRETLEQSYSVLVDPMLTPVLIEMVVASAIAGRVGFDRGGSVAIGLDVTCDKRQPVHLEDLYSVADAGNIASGVASLVASVVDPLWTNPFSRLQHLTVDVQLDIRDRPASLRLLSARVSPSELRAGEALRVEYEMRDYRRRTRRFVTTLTLPDDTRPGEVTFHLGDAGSLVDLDRKSGRRGVERSLSDRLSNLRRRRRRDRLYFLISRTVQGLELGGQALPALPPSVRVRLGRGGAGAHRRALPRQVLLEKQVDLEAQVSGSLTLTLTIMPAEPS